MADPIESLLERTHEERAFLDNALRKNPLLLFLIGKKGAGKSARIKVLHKALPEHFDVIPVGDLARSLQEDLEERGIEAVAQDLIEHLPQYSIEEIAELLEPFVELEGTKLKSTDIILSLVKKALAEKENTSIILDGFPRSPEQIEHAKDLVEEFSQKGYKPLFVDIDIPESVQDMRMLHRRLCPECGSSKNIALWPTDEFGYDEDNDEFFMYCDEQGCHQVRMVGKAYDDAGASQMKERDQITQDMIDQIKEQLAAHAFTISNAIPVEHKDQYEPHDLTEVTRLSWDGEKVVKTTEPLLINDTQGKEAYSGNPEPWIMDFIKEVYNRYQ